ncbi:MAG: molecular chaperone HtpG [Spirochaetia bacterium]|nr:molecular chaperone HtpG [Spirochaetia bacterium]
MSKKEQEDVKEYSFQAEMEQLMHLIVHSLYTHKEIFLRELISNASDAMQKLRFIELTEKDIEGVGEELKINIKLDEKKNQIIVEDNGIGMTEEELKQNLGTVAKSGTLNFLKELKAKENESKTDLIGQFGVGFYSVFMVANEVTVKSKSYQKNEKAMQWTSTGTGKYSIAPSDKNNRGTEIIIQLKKEEKEYTGEYTIKNIIQKYSSFVEFPIQVGEEHVNKSSALWRKKTSEIKTEDLNEFYKFISHDFNEPLGHIHLNAEGALTYSALLFIPEKTTIDVFQKPDEFHVHLYLKKVFIQNDCKELLPSYLRFLKGVVDSEDLPLNVSREVTQHSAVLAKIKKALTSRVIKLLEGWAEKEPEKFLKFYKGFGNIFKEGVESDYENKDKLVNLLRFKSSSLKDDAWTSFADYLGRMKAEQKKIYYLGGRNLESLRSSPALEYFSVRGIEVLLITDLIDEYLMPVIAKYNEMEIIHVEKAEVESSENKAEDTLDENDKKNFISRIKNILADKTEDIRESNRLVNSPCILVSSAGPMNPQMEQMMKMMNPDYKAPKKIMELNFNHPLIRKLVESHKKDAVSPELEKSVKTMFDALTLLEDKLENPNQLVENLFEYMNQSLA